jgi:hypothetical protein
MGGTTRGTTSMGASSTDMATGMGATRAPRADRN